MSSSSRPEDRGWPGDRRGQTEPIAALVAVLAIAVGLALYAGVAADQQPEPDEPDAEATMERVTTDLLEDGVLDPNGYIRPERYERPGESVRISVEWKGRITAYFGPDPPPDADVARRPVTLAPRDGVQYSGVLIVEVWES